RAKQQAFNAAHGIVPRGIVKPVVDVMEGARSARPGAGSSKTSSRRASQASGTNQDVRLSHPSRRYGASNN
ncbi:MAG: excinuclease ABC subunit B, partial [Steroidobacteraceae bacterium]